MKLKHSVMIAAGLGLAAVACKKETGAGPAAQNPVVMKASDNDVIGDYFMQKRAQNTQTFEVNPAEGGEFVSERGVRINIAPNALRSSTGEILQEPVTVSLLEVFDRSDMLFNNRVTESVFNDDGTGGEPIVTGGAFDLGAKTASGEDVTIPNGGVQMRVPADITGGPDPDMTLWTGVQSPDQARDNAWQDDGGKPNVDADNNYVFPITDWDRINVDKAMQFGGQPTSYKADIIPHAGFTPANTEIFMLIDGLPGMLASMDVYDPATLTWTEHTPYIPVGVNVHFIAVAYVGGQLYAKIQSSTIVANHFEHITGLAPMSEAALAAAINSL